MTNQPAPNLSLYLHKHTENASGWCPYLRDALTEAKAREGQIS